MQSISRRSGLPLQRVRLLLHPPPKRRALVNKTNRQENALKWDEGSTRVALIHRCVLGEATRSAAKLLTGPDKLSLPSRLGAPKLAHRIAQHRTALDSTRPVKLVGPATRGLQFHSQHAGLQPFPPGLQT